MFVRPTTLAVLALLALGACKTAEERAEEYFQNGLELLASGDVDRAILEFRNVFQLDMTHLGARRELARVLLEEKQDKQRAYRQYLRIAEQYPDDLETRLILAEIALSAGSWEEVERHGSHAEQLAPEDPRVQAISLARRYRGVASKEDLPAMREIARQMEEMLEAQPDSFPLRVVRVDASLREGDYATALADIDWILERDPDNQQLLRQRLNVLAQQGDDAAIEAQLRDMITRFSDNDTYKATLIRYYMSREQTDKAEAYLRELAEASTEPGPRMDLVRFLMEVRGADVAKAELDEVIARADNPVPFQLIQAALDFDQGERETAIAMLEDIVRDAPPSEEIHNAKVTLVQMLLATGNEVGARARIAEVLAEDKDHPQALKIQAAWQIEADDTDTAIANLRLVLDQEPEDAQAMALMAQAYERAGRPELAQDFMALAVESSGNAPAETIRYARVLMGDKKYLPAEDILLSALRLAPQNVDLLITIGELYLAMDDLGRVEQVARSLRDIGSNVATEAANGLEAQRIGRQSGTEDAVAYLEDLAGAADASLNSRLALVRARLVTGDLEGALELARSLREEESENPIRTAILANVEALAGNLDTAESLYSTLLEDDPMIGSQVWLQLAQIKIRQGEPDAAKAVVEEGLSHMPEDGRLLWAKASYLERDGDIDEAVEIYEGLYARNSGSVVVANNLASMLATYRDDAESLERAWVVARRFKEAEVPALQDTYGWIVHRRGDSETALSYMEAAAKGLPRDAIVQYHLAEVYRSLGRTEDALNQYRTAVEVAGPTDQRKQIAAAREQLSTLQEQAEN